MHHLRLLAIALFFSVSSVAQNKIPLIHSGQLLEKGKALYDSGKYDDAVNTFLTIPARDTNYYDMLGELALTYIAMKKPEKAVLSCEEALKIKSQYRAFLLKNQAIALDHKGDFEKSVSVFLKAIEEYPFDYSLKYNLGITYYNHGDYQKAEKCFFEVIYLNPFHAGSHYNLGRIAVNEGRNTHAMMALGVYLSIRNNDNEVLVWVDKFLSGQLEEDGKTEAIGENGCEKLDQIIRAKVALDPKFKTVMPLRAPVVQQYEMLLQQLGTIRENAQDPYVHYYLPFYKEVLQRNHSDPFLYNVLTSAANEDLKKWRKKNEKLMEVYFPAASSSLRKNRQYITAPAALGFSEPVMAWFDNDSGLEGLGNKSGEKQTGRWIYYFTNGEKQAEGNFNDKAEKTGTWKYYNVKGDVKSIEDYNTGEITLYYDNGVKHEHYFLKNDLTEGALESYFSCGAVKEKSTWKAGKRDGKVTTYFATGPVDVSYSAIAGLKTGELLSYYENGKLYSSSFYKEGKLDGAYKQYYLNEKPAITGNYVAGNSEGEWKYYLTNGILEKIGSFKNGIAVGLWKYYDKNSVITEELTNDADGELEGEDINYHDGKKYIVNTYKKGIITKVSYFDSNGKRLGEYGDAKGNFNVKSFYPTGEFRSEGSFKNGLRQGAWKFFYRSGQLESIENYNEGHPDGVVKEYFKNGNKKSINEFKNGDLHGYSQTFYINGNVKNEGWIQNGDRQQQWLEYFADGTIEADTYYLNDNLESFYNDFSEDGKISRRSYYSNAMIDSVRDYDHNGKSVLEEKRNGAAKIMESHFKDGKTKVHFELTCGKYSGKISRNYSNGNPSMSVTIMDGLRHGIYTSYDFDGKLEMTGDYVNGYKEGLWNAYEEGVLESKGNYFDNKQDSIWIYFNSLGKKSSSGNFADDERHGITTYYSPDGAALYQKKFENGDLIAYRGLIAPDQFGDWIPFKDNASLVFNYSNGTKAYTEEFKNGLTTGVRRLYYPNGNIYSEYSFESGDYQGPYSIYHPNGKPIEKGTYQWDEADGKTEYYNEDGSLRKIVSFKNGIKHGKVILFNKGVKQKELDFWLGHEKE